MPLCKKCHSSNTRKRGRTCSQCHLFFHLSCAKLSRLASASIQTWACPSCLFKSPHNPPHPPRPSPTDGTSVTCAEDTNSLLIDLSLLRKSRKIPLRIPKSARLPAASCLETLISEALTSEDLLPWLRLLCFVPLGLGSSVDTLGDGRPLHSKIKENLQILRENRALPPLHNTPDLFVPQKRDPVNGLPSQDRIKRDVSRKLLDGDIRAALRVLSSNDKIADNTPETLTQLKNKHPVAPDDLRSFAPTEDTSITPITEEEVLLAIKAFPASSSGGLDGLRPSHIKDMVGRATSNSSTPLVRSLTTLIQRILTGDIPSKKTTEAFVQPSLLRAPPRL